MWYGALTAAEEPANGVVDLAAGWDGETLYALAGNGLVSRYDPQARIVTPLFRVDPRGFSEDCPPRLAVAQGGHILATDYEQIAVWDPAAGQPCPPIDCNDGPITYPCFVDNGRALYTVARSADWLIRWSWPGREELALPDHLGDLTEFPIAAVTNWTGTHLAVRNSGGLVVLWDVAKDRLLMTVETGAKDSEDVAMAISPDGETFVVGHGNTLRRCQVRRGKVAQTTAVETGPLSRVAFHPDSCLFATADAAPLVSFWDAESGNKTRSFELPFRAVKSLVFSLDGYTCAAGGDGREFAVWDVYDR